MEHPLREETMVQQLMQVIECARHSPALCPPCAQRLESVKEVLDDPLGITFPDDREVVMFGAIGEVDQMTTSDLIKFCREVKKVLHGAFYQVRVRIATPQVQANL